MAAENPWKKLPTGSNVPEVIHIIVEIPKGSRNKYEFGSLNDTVFLRLERVLFSSIQYPVEQGIVPRAIFEDGNPLEALLLMDEPTFPGCVVEARPIGILRLLENEKRTDKLLTVPTADVKYSEISDVNQLPWHLAEEIAHFFAIHRSMDNRKVEVIGWTGADSAKKMVLHGMKLFETKFERKQQDL